MPGRPPVPAAAPRARAPARWVKPAVAAACCIPLAKLVADVVLGRLGANPVEKGLNHLGFWALAFVVLALAPTPLHGLLGWRWPQRVRRILGLFAFGYASLHLAWYAGVDKALDAADIVADVTRRGFQAAGLLAWLSLLPLAVTSTDGWVRRLGHRRWKRLHRLAYVAAGLGVLHFVWRVKADLRSPAIFGAILGALLLARVALTVRGARARARPAAQRASERVSA